MIADNILSIINGDKLVMGLSSKDCRTINSEKLLFLFSSIILSSVSDTSERSETSSKPLLGYFFLLSRGFWFKSICICFLFHHPCSPPASESGVGRGLGGSPFAQARQGYRDGIHNFGVDTKHLLGLHSAPLLATPPMERNVGASQPCPCLWSPDCLTLSHRLSSMLCI